jgi:putative endonuclease
MFWMYILKSERTGKYYVGHTSNLEERLSRHNRGLTKTTRRLGVPWKVVYKEEHGTKVEAIRRESQVKSWKDREAIERLIRLQDCSGISQ